MPLCSRCNIHKGDEEFNYRNKSNGIRQRACRLCTRKQVKRHYYSNKEYYLKKTRIRNKYFKQKIREYIWDYLADNPCVDCGETDPVVLEFDHVLTKSINITEMAHLNCSLSKVQAEIDKCEVRCANCHRRKTSLQFGWYRK